MRALHLSGGLPAGGQRFALHFAPRGPARGLVVHAHAFAEEMNKSRRMVGLGARALCNAGYAVLLIDLHGCGDSSGELAEASWAGWRADLLQGLQFLQAEHGPAPRWLWGTRAGALLACDAARALEAPCNFLFWQAQANGKQALTQFLRLKMAGQMQQDGAVRGITEGLMSELTLGRCVDVAGYSLGPDVALGLAAATLAPGAGHERSRLVWLETSSRTPAELLPAANGALDRWRQAGFTVSALAVNGPSFWQTLEIEDAPALIEATVLALEADLPFVAA
jgi:uncharacterized protein